MARRVYGLERGGEGAAVAGGNATAATLAERVYYELRRHIRDGALVPGEALRLAVLRDRFGVGFTPLREAMMRLVTERFIQLSGQKGFRVAPATLDDFEDLIETRRRLEMLVIPEAVAHGDVQWEASVLAAFHTLSRRPLLSEGSGLLDPAWSAAHERFHRALVEAVPSVRMKWLWLWLFEHSERYRALLVRSGRELGDDRAAHEDILHGVLARDAGAVLVACDRHDAVFRAHVRAHFGAS